MPSAYCVIYALSNTTGTQVFVVTKSGAVPNNPGQVVYSGGRMNGGETGAAAAAREFHEETGVAIDLAGNRIMTTKPVTILGQNVRNYTGYSALFLHVGALADLMSVKADVKINLDRHRTDGELVACDVMTKRQAYATFVNENRPTNPKLATDWFIAITNDIP